MGTPKGKADDAENERLDSPATTRDVEALADVSVGDDRPATKGDLKAVAATIPNLNGTLDSIKRIAKLEPQLTTLVNDVLPDWHRRAEHSHDNETFYRVLRERLRWKYTRYVLAVLGTVLLEEPVRGELILFLHSHHLFGY